MDRYLLSILEREKKLVLEKESCDEEVKRLCNELGDSKRLFEKVDDQLVKHSKIDEELRIVRNEMREYFQELFKGGA